MTPPCRHLNTTIVSYGGFHLEGGEMWDDVVILEVCQDCGKIIEDEDFPEDDDSDVGNIPF